MKKYTVRYKRRAQKMLSKMDNQVQIRIKNWIKKNLEGCENPRAHGRALEGELRTFWRYRVGDYRIVADIQDEQILILIVEIDKRNDIYK